MKIFSRSSLFLFVISFNFFSCQSPQISLDEKTRQQHAKEILNESYKNSVVERFENDPLFSKYIESYLSKTSFELSKKEVAKTIIEISKTNNYDPIFLMAVIKTESQFKPRTIGSAGEIGLMQIKPDTAKWICQKLGYKWKGEGYLVDPNYNIEVGALYFKYLKKSLNSRASHYITAYNRGLGSLSRLPAAEVKTNPYFVKVLKNYILIYNELEKIKISLKMS